MFCAKVAVNLNDTDLAGKSACYTDVDDPDWVPSLNLGFVIEEEEQHSASSSISNDAVDLPTNEDVGNVLVNEDAGNVSTNASKKAPASVATSSTGSQTLVSTSSIGSQTFVPTSSTGSQTFVPTSSIGTQTDGTITGMSDELLFSYKEQIQLLEKMLNKRSVVLSNFEGDDKKTKFFTGISHYATMKAIFELIQSKISNSRKLTNFQIFFMVLTKLRLNLSFRYLSYQFDVSLQTISTHFYKCLLELHKKLKSFVYWPSRENIKRTTPSSFKNSFGDAIVVILDCFEIFCEKPSNQKAMIQCYSRYKHAYTIKYLIGITPQGFISFISKGFGGKSSDKFVTENSGFFDKVQMGDVVMADRGFLIEEELLHRGVELSIPAFTKGKNQLNPREVEGTRSIANVRIHVERVIGQLRQKFNILHQFKFPISLIKKKSASAVNVIDQIVTVCSALSNLCTPIVCKISNEETLE